MDGGVGVAPAGVPEAVRPEAVGGHEADLGRLLGPGDVGDANTGGEAFLRLLELVGGRAAEIRLLVLKLLHGPDARRVDRDQQILMGLQVEGARAGRTGVEIENLRVPGIADVDRGDAVAEPMADIGEAAMDHDLHAVAAPTKIRMADELDALGCHGIHRFRSTLQTRSVLSTACRKHRMLKRPIARRRPAGRRPGKVVRYADRRGCRRRDPESVSGPAPTRRRSRNFPAHAWRSVRSSAR